MQNHYSHKAETFFNDGIIKQRDGKHDEAILYFSQALDMCVHDTKDTADIYFCRGLGYAELRQYEKALTDFDASIKLNDSHYRSYGWRGIAWYNLNNYINALEDFDAALTLNPNFTSLYQYRGRTRTYLGDDEGAVYDWDRVIKNTPNDAEAYYRRGLANAMLGHHYQALRDLYTAKRYGNPSSSQLIKQIEFTTDNIYRIISAAA